MMRCPTLTPPLSAMPPRNRLQIWEQKSTLTEKRAPSLPKCSRETFKVPNLQISVFKYVLVWLQYLAKNIYTHHSILYTEAKLVLGIWSFDLNFHHRCTWHHCQFYHRLSLGILQQFNSLEYLAIRLIINTPAGSPALNTCYTTLQPRCHSHDTTYSLRSHFQYSILPAEPSHSYNPQSNLHTHLTPVPVHYII